MTTRSGRRYHEEKGNIGMTEIADLVKTMIEDRKVREAQFEAEQRRLREAADLHGESADEGSSGQRESADEGPDGDVSGVRGGYPTCS